MAEIDGNIKTLETHFGLRDSESLKAVLGEDLGHYRTEYAKNFAVAEQRLDLIEQVISRKLRGPGLLQAQGGLRDFRRALGFFKESSLSQQMQRWDGIDSQITEMERNLGIRR